ncbi:hypothetical protein C0J52_08220 [Blattella germanica]|nr:hypothetical protein C0J52_08220 [Blattella germanica]
MSVLLSVSANFDPATSMSRAAPTSSIQRREVNNTRSVPGHKVNSTNSVPNENPAVLVGCQRFPSHSILA